jgi:hypothetical protein
LAGLLLAGLPGPTLAALAEIFGRAAPVDDDNPGQLYALIDGLANLAQEGLDRAPPRAVVALNAHAPAQRITGAVEEFVRDLKAREGIPNTRRRDDKLPEYLAVWDAREGWTGRGYDPGQERTLQEITLDRKKPLSTVANHYTAAFYWIVGRDYTPELWARLVGFYKAAMFHDVDELPARYRVLVSERHGPAPVPESRLARRGDRPPPRPVNTAGVNPDELSLNVLVVDIQTLIAKGSDNRSIIEELELTSPDAPLLVEYLRRRHLDSI